MMDSILSVTPRCTNGALHAVSPTDGLQTHNRPYTLSSSPQAYCERRGCASELHFKWQRAHLGISSIASRGTGTLLPSGISSMPRRGCSGVSPTYSRQLSGHQSKRYRLLSGKLLNLTVINEAFSGRSQRSCSAIVRTLWPMFSGF
jgi:hypothetical protein